ncbi:MAG: carboxylesterase family protein [Dactylosporangium sp.]|nr:carboxylesterase family protein [Dactylosporangium sp.]NNJ62799.1 carboxylesterase family protein [Dactylosporangium sp.]
MRIQLRQGVRNALALTLTISTVLVVPAATAAPATATTRGGTAGGTATGVVRTETGPVRGTGSGDVDSFLGIPYAQAPVGDLRWQPPRPAESWSGVRETVAYGNRCPARASTNGPRSETEDCLYLNVQRPATAHRGQRLPVYVWIHGGGLLNGGGDQHDGELIVSRTGVVVVTLNYRLGMFGFLAHPGLTAQAGQSGNYGLLDQQAALWWVQRNIAAFGGDPRRVTIGGESAGGFSVCAHLSAPGSRGTFSRAMIQSGSCVSQPLAEAEATGVAVARSVGCLDETTAVACLRQTSSAALLDATPAASVRFVREVPELPLDPAVAVSTGRFARVPLVIGANRDEGRTFALGLIGWDEEQVTAWIRATFPDRAEAVLAAYPWPADADTFTPAYLAGAIMTDSGMIAGIGGCATRELTATFARHTRTFAYEFGHRTGPGLAPEPAGYVWGAGHAAELAYLWPSFDNGTPIAPTFDAAERQLAADLVDAWGQFVRTGRPGAAGSTRWPDVATGDAVMDLRAGGQSVVVSDAGLASTHRCEIWAPAA